jgi:hypothetical protein
VVAKNPRGEALWTASWLWAETPVVRAPTPVAAKPEVRDEGAEFWVRSGEVEARFSKVNGSLMSVARGGQKWSLGEGVRIAAYSQKDKAFENHSYTLRRPRMSQQPGEAGDVTVFARDDERKVSLTWRVQPDGVVALEYEYEYDGAIDLLGVTFDYPEANVKSKRWFGRGPFRVYRNRLEGGVLGLHDLAFNDPVPGQSYAYPEFKGYFRDWAWVRLETTEGPIIIERDAGASFLGLYAPRDGEPSMLAFPDTGIAFLDVIPAIGTKFSLAVDGGPQGQPVRVSGVKRGSVTLRFGEN